jgi:hypothetical protein
VSVKATRRPEGADGGALALAAAFVPGGDRDGGDESGSEYDWKRDPTGTVDGVSSGDEMLSAWNSCRRGAGVELAVGVNAWRGLGVRTTVRRVRVGRYRGAGVSIVSVVVILSVVTVVSVVCVVVTSVVGVVFLFVDFLRARRTAVRSSLSERGRRGARSGSSGPRGTGRCRVRPPTIAGVCYVYVYVDRLRCCCPLKCIDDVKTTTDDKGQARLRYLAYVNATRRGKIRTDTHSCPRHMVATFSLPH